MFKTPLQHKAHQHILRYSSTATAVTALENEGETTEDAEEAVLDVIMIMIAGAPQEIRGSIEYVISWWRWNEIYEASKSARNLKQMTFAQNNMDMLLRNVHS